jgi:hypothetical protein
MHINGSINRKLIGAIIDYSPCVISGRSAAEGEADAKA